MSPEACEISDDFLPLLKQGLVHRRVGQGMARLQERCWLFSALDTEQKNAARFAGYLAQWVDIGFQRPALVKQVISRFPTSIRTRLFCFSEDELDCELRDTRIANLSRAECSEGRVPVQLVESADLIGPIHCARADGFGSEVRMVQHIKVFSP